MAAKTKTTNEMIYDTLTTTVRRTPKYADQLRELGYEVEKSTEYWSVNGVSPSLYGKMGLYLRGRYIEGKQRIAKVDFVDFLAKRDERKGKVWNVADDGKIWSRCDYFVRKDERYRRYKRKHFHDYMNGNHVVDEYRQLKRKADTGDSRSYGWDTIERAERRMAETLKEIDELQEKLERAQRSYKKRVDEYYEAKASQAEGETALQKFLEVHGVR